MLTREKFNEQLYKAIRVALDEKEPVYIDIYGNLQGSYDDHIAEETTDLIPENELAALAADMVENYFAKGKTQEIEKKLDHFWQEYQSIARECFGAP